SRDGPPNWPGTEDNDGEDRHDHKTSGGCQGTCRGIRTPQREVKESTKEGKHRRVGDASQQHQTECVQVRFSFRRKVSCSKARSASVKDLCSSNHTSS